MYGTVTVEITESESYTENGSNPNANTNTTTHTTTYNGDYIVSGDMDMSPGIESQEVRDAMFW